MPDDAPLVRAARAWGAWDGGHYEWQIKIPDAPRFFRAIAPVLEARLAASPFAGLTQDVALNLYRAIVTPRFESGALASVEERGYVDEGEIRIPALLLPALVLGWRSREELRAAHSDVGIWGQSRYLIDVLFPPMRGFLYTRY